MQKPRLGILHPGNMGVSVAASARNSGCEVYWASQGRSAATQARADEQGLRNAGTVEELCRTCAVILSVCPPHAAEEVAEEVMRHGYRGLYVDANAISPQRVASLGQRMAATGVSFVDGGIIGGPAWQPGTTWFYLAGEEAEAIADCFDGGPLETIIMEGEVGRASALKMAYAAWSKGSTALMCGVLAAARELGVWDELAVRWDADREGFTDQSVNRARRVTEKAWRFAGEMDEIAATFEAAGLPGGFHAAAAELYRRMADFKETDALPPIGDVLAALVAPARSATGRPDRE
jgi:3-hydroxyisobutyrate dehydrogenase-like beta-hydroxyacid dehydrogenase